jgi:hypothetical protein
MKIFRRYQAFFEGLDHDDLKRHTRWKYNSQDCFPWESEARGIVLK